MFNFFKKKRKKHTISCDTDTILVNDVALDFPTNYDKLIAIFGTPTRELQKSKQYLIWDEDGVLCGYNDANEILSINFYQNKKDKSEYNTKKQFIGSLIFNEKDISNNEFDKIAIGKYAIHRLGSESEIRFGFSLGINNNYSKTN